VIHMQRNTETLLNVSEVVQLALGRVAPSATTAVKDGVEAALARAPNCSAVRKRTCGKVFRAASALAPYTAPVGDPCEHCAAPLFCSGTCVIVRRQAQDAMLSQTVTAGRCAHA
jgi:hypothetical protein